MQNIPKIILNNWRLDELKVTPYDSMHKLIHKKCHWQSHHNDIDYHMTQSPKFIVVCEDAIVLGEDPGN